MDERILFVDDEEHILAAFRRQLKSQYEVYTANSGQQGLDMIKEQGPFAVIVADMRMPGMSGVHFLSIIKGIAPDSVRMMLTGNADQNTAIEAINRGNIFRFLTKPCQRDELVAALEDALKQYRLITAERIVLEKTLIGSVNILTEILGMVNPAAFNRTTRVRVVVKHLCTILTQENRMENAWQVELAAMLSQVGCVTLPLGIMEKVYAGEVLSNAEQEMYSKHPAIGSKLIQSIPRLETVAQLIRDQQRYYNEFPPANSVQAKYVDLGAQVLKIAIDYDQLLETGLAHEEAVKILKSRIDEYNPHCLSLICEQPPDLGEWVIRKITVSELEVGIILNEDIFSRTSKFLMSRGTRVTPLVLERMVNFDSSTGIIQPFSVRVPDYLTVKFKD